MYRTDLTPFGNWQVPGKGKRVTRNNPFINQDFAARVATDNIKFAANLSLGKSPYLWDEIVVGATASSTWYSDRIGVEMVVQNDGDYAIRQTLEWINYQAGAPQDSQNTGRMSLSDGVTCRIGQFYGSFVAPYNPLNGICFETIDGILYATVFDGGNASRTPQSSWNMDRLDGSNSQYNPSGIQIDVEQMQLFALRYKWLGDGDIIWYVEINGSPIFVHYETHFNLQKDTYMKSATLPIRYEIRSTGGSGSMWHQCNKVSSSGGEMGRGISGSIDTDGVPIDVLEGQRRLVMASRINPLTPNHSAEFVRAFTMNLTANGFYRYFVVWNPIITGTENWVTIPDSAMQIWMGDGTNNITSGFQMDAGYADKNAAAARSDVPSTLGYGVGINGRSDVIALGVEAVSNTCSIVGGISAMQLL